MTTMLAGVGPAGRGVLTAMMLTGRLPDLCADGLVVVDPDPSPGGGALAAYNVRSDSAAAVFALCVEAVRDEPELCGSEALATIEALPDGESVALSSVGKLLTEGTAPLLRRIVGLGADLRLGTEVTAVHPRPGGGADVTLVDRTGRRETLTVGRLVMAVGGVPHVPDGLLRVATGRLVHSDSLLRATGLRRVLDELPQDPRIVVVGRAHSAFSVADRLLSSEPAEAWAAGAVTVATRGQVRVTYDDRATARADGASFTEADVCPQSGRVWRLCGLRGDAARRYRLGRDGLDPRLVIAELRRRDLARAAKGADLVVAATGYRTAALDAVRGAVSTRPSGALHDASGRELQGIRAIGLGSGSRRSDLLGGEPSYVGPVDGVWHYQTVVAPTMLEDLFGAVRTTGARVLTI